MAALVLEAENNNNGIFNEDSNSENEDEENSENEEEENEENEENNGTPTINHDNNNNNNNNNNNMEVEELTPEEKEAEEYKKLCEKYGPEGGKVPLHFLAVASVDNFEKVLEKFFEIYGASIDLNINSIQRDSPLRYAILNLRNYQINLFLSKGASVRTEHSSKIPFISLALQRGAEDHVIRQLLACKVDLNERDSSTNSLPVHYAVAKRSYLQALVEFGANLEAQNGGEHPKVKPPPKVKPQGPPPVNGDRPIHMAVKARNLDVLKFLLEKKVDINARGLFDRTAIQYAVNSSSSSIDADYELEYTLVQHKANVNLCDNKGRTALHYAFVKMLRGQLRDNTANDPIEIVTTIMSADADPNVADKYLRTPLHYAAQHAATISSMFLISRKALVDVVDCDGNTPLSLAVAHRQAQYAITLIREKANVNHPVMRVLKEKKEGVTVKKTLEKETMFKSVVQYSWQGVGYLMLEAGFPYIKAMEDAAAQEKFQLLINLLNKTSAEILKQKNEKGENLIHIVAKSSQFTPAVLEALKRKGVPVDEVDKEGNSPVHNAAKSNNSKLLNWLYDEKADMGRLLPNGESVFSRMVEHHFTAERKNWSYFGIFHDLKKWKADVNLNQVYKGKTLLISALEKAATQDVISHLLESGANLNVGGVDGVTPVMMCVKKNDMKTLTLFLSKAKSESLNVNKQDSEGKTCLHYVVNPVEYGSFENVALLELLVSKGADINIKDKKNHPPLYYAHMQDSKRLYQALLRLGAAPLPNLPSRAKTTFMAVREEPPNYDDDAKALLRSLPADELLDNTPKPDPNYARAEHSVVYKTPEGVYYDLLMTKVDVKQGAYGLNNFYRMQILKDKVKDLFVLFTGWGRIGQGGQYQQTACGSEEEARIEFEKIFKAKSGNKWGTPFVKHPGKYRLHDIDYSVRVIKDGLKPFDWEKLDAPKAPVKSHLPEAVRSTWKLFAQHKVYDSAVRQQGINLNLLPLGKLTKELIAEARRVLDDLSRVIDGIDEQRKEATPDLEVMQENYQKISDLSSVFFELIPHGDYAAATIREISTKDEVNREMKMLTTLGEVEIASKILLGATHRVNEIYPVDYVYKALNIQVDVLDKEGNEFKLLRDYAQNTGLHSGHGANWQLENFFRLQRHGEPERIEKWSNLDNHLLLWHGSGLQNFVGILSQGLRIAPPEAAVSGYLFGRGVYFADMLSKSLGYSGYEDSACLLLCEVALGKMQTVTVPGSAVLPLSNEYNSVMCLGRNTPDWNQRLVLPNGVVVPTGKVVPRQELAEDKTIPYHMEHNEYIVYDVTQVRIRYLVHLKKTGRHGMWNC